MAVQSTEAQFHLSGAGSFGGAQPDPDASLGGSLSSTKLYHTESTLTSAMTAPTVFVDSAQIGAPDRTGDWVLFVTGANLLEAARIEDFEPGTGRFRVHRPLALGSSGDAYRLHSPGNLFDAVSPDDAAAGHVDHRLIFLHNVTLSPSEVLTAPRFYVVPLQVGGITIETAADDSDQGSVPSIADEEDEPDLSALGASVVFTRALVEAAAQERPQISTGSQARAVWIRRTVPAATPTLGESVFLLVMATSNAGGTPDPFVTGALVVFESQGFVPAIEISRDRFQYVGGGGRFTARVATETGLPVPEIFVEWSLTGPGSLFANPGVDQTNEDGEHTVTYHSPDDPAEEGNMATLAVAVI